MSPDSERHDNEHEQLRETLELYPGIRITAVEGDPPDSYEIEYHLKGYVRNPDGSVSTADLHRVRITLPFGYPHFPPTVKPLTHIFHPDIDPAAIRIADHWQEKPNLTDLVLTIGEMICGNIYSLDEPFNQEAADWYEQHQADLPLDVLQIADIADSDERFDTLDEDTFSSLGLDDEDLFGDDIEESGEDEGRLDLVRLQIDQKNFFAASRTLSEIPSTVNIPDREQLEQTIATALKSSDRLFKQVEHLESEGNLDEAAEVIGELEGVAADTPGLEELRNRILQSRSLADSFSIDTLTDEREQAESTTDEPLPSQKKEKKRKTSGSSLPVKSLLVATLLVVIGAVSGVFYMKDSSILEQGKKDLGKVQSFIATRQYIDAQSEAEAILRNLEDIVLLRSAGKTLAGKVNGLLDTEDFRQGLLGNTLFDGRYVSFARAEVLARLNKLVGAAEAMVRKGKIRKALPAYEEALSFARKNDLMEEARELAQVINNLRFEDALATAKKAEDDKEWENAANTYRRALELSRDLSDPNEAAEITRRLTTASFRHELDRSKKSFTGAQWEETITMLRHAQELISRNSSAVSLREREELNRLLLDSQLYQKLTVAREAYEAGDLTMSIRQYEDALAFLDSKGDAFGPGIRESYSKIERTLLMMRIALLQRQVTAARERNELQKAMDGYDAILRLVAESPQSGDAALQKVTVSVREQQKALRSQLEMKKRTDYLKEHYQDIFLRNYPSFAGSKLSDPKVTFERKIGKRLLFTMSCTERSMGSSSRLELQYLYNPDTDSWSLYTGQ